MSGTAAATPGLRLSHYAGDLRALRTTIASQSDGKLRLTPTAVAVIIVNVQGPEATLPVYLWAANLYVMGFSTGTRSYFFDDTDPTRRSAITALGTWQGQRGISAERATSAWLGFGGDYGALGTHGTLADKVVDGEAIRQAVARLAAYGGASTGETKFHLAILIHLLSEALRIREVAAAVAGALVHGRFASESGVERADGSFTFKQFQNLVTNWDALSTGTANTTAKETGHVAVLTR